MIKRLLISVFTLSMIATSAQAGLISGNINDTVLLPTSTELNALPESDTDVFLYSEQENFLLTSDLSVDYFGSTLTEGIISSGSTINSFFLNFDAVGTDYTTNSFNGFGSYLFDTEILGIIWSGTRPSAQPSSNMYLDASDIVLGLAGTSYATGAIGRGLEPENFYGENTTQDVVRVSGPNNRQLDISLFVKPAYADQLRVITAAKIPEPTSLLLFGTAAICLLNLRRTS